MVCWMCFLLHSMFEKLIFSLHIKKNIMKITIVLSLTVCKINERLPLCQIKSALWLSCLLEGYCLLPQILTLEYRDLFHPTWMHAKVIKIMTVSAVVSPGGEKSSCWFFLILTGCAPILSSGAHPPAIFMHISDTRLHLFVNNTVF